MIENIKVSIAAGEGLLFLENSFGSVSVEDFEQFLRTQEANVYLVLGLLLSEKLISIIVNDRKVKIISLTGELAKHQLQHV